MRYRHSNLILFSVPRSGSRLIYTVIQYALRQQCGFVGLKEYLNIENRDPVYKKGEIFFEGLNKAPAEIAKVHSNPKFEEKLVNQRIAMLKKIKAPFVLKLIATRFSPLFLENFMPTSQVVVLKRKDVWQEYLSYLVSLTSGRWYEPDGLRIPSRSLVATRHHLQAYLYLKSSLIKTQQQFNLNHEIYFEELLQMSFDEILAQVGYSLPVDWRQIEFYLFPRQNKGDKLKLFQNPEEVTKWFDEVQALESLTAKARPR